MELPMAYIYEITICELEKEPHTIQKSNGWPEKNLNRSYLFSKFPYLLGIIESSTAMEAIYNEERNIICSYFLRATIYF